MFGEDELELLHGSLWCSFSHNVSQMLNLTGLGLKLFQACGSTALLDVLQALLVEGAGPVGCLGNPIRFCIMHTITASCCMQPLLGQLANGEGVNSGHPPVGLLLEMCLFKIT